MALTPLDMLARRQQLAGVAMATTVARDVRRAMAPVDLRERDELTAAINQVTPTLLQRQARMIANSRDYYSRARQQAKHGGLVPDVIEADREERMRSSLYIVGRGRLGKRTTDRGYARAKKTAVNEMVGAAVRHTLDAGRENTIEMVKADEVALGFVRVTSQDNRVCAFCMMLASREDYKETSFGRSDARFIFGDNALANAKVHDRCRCSIRPVFYGEGTPEATKIAQRLWYELSEGDGREAFLSFRRKWEARLRNDTTPVWQAA